MKRICLISLVAATAAVASDEPVNFAEHIAPIMFENCASCHRPGEAAPFSLTNYESTKRRARTIQRVVEDRYMPPWQADEGWGNFHGERRLTDEQIALIGKWVETGTPEGDAAKTPQLPKFPEGWELGEPDIVLEMEEAYEVYAEGKDIYRYFVLPLGLEEEKWVRAVEVRPSARSVVHHALFFLDASGQARKLDGQDGTPGFNRKGFRPSNSLGGWAVGGSTLDLGEGYAKPMPAGSDFVLQTHFHPSGKVEHEKTKVGLYFADGPPEKKLVEFQVPPTYGAMTGLNIGPGETFEIRDHMIVPEDMDIITVWGHAHQTCTSMQAEATLPDGTKQKLMRIGEWDFNWQDQYLYQEPVRLPKGTRIDTVITYDNTPDNPFNPNHPPRRIYWGEESTDEMGSVIFQTVAADGSRHSAMQSGLRRQRGASVLRHSKAVKTALRRYFVLQLDTDFDDRLTFEETPPEHHETFKKLDTDNDKVVTVAEIDAGASILDVLGRGNRRR
ncbi:MAG: cytochrome c [Verrucomicrobiota bacterium]